MFAVICASIVEGLIPLPVLLLLAVVLGLPILLVIVAILPPPPERFRR